MTNRQKNIIGGAGFGVLFLAGVIYAAWSWYPKNSDTAYQNKIMAMDVSQMDGPQMETFIRGLQVERLTTEQKVELWNKVLNHFFELPPKEMAALLKSAREEMEKNPGSQLSLNAQQLMQADTQKKARNYLSANAAQRQQILDKEIARQQSMAAMGFMGMRGNGAPTAQQTDALKTQITFWTVEGMKNQSPADRAAMTQMFTDLRQRRIDRGLPTLW